VYTLTQLRAHLTARVGLTQAAASVQAWQDQAIGQMIDSCWWRIMETAFVDCAVDGVTQRWFLPGENIQVLPPSRQSQPNGLNTAGIASPLLAPTLSASGSGSTLPAGTYRAAFAWVSAAGETLISPVLSVLIAAGQNIVIGVPALITGATSAHCYLSPPNATTWLDQGTTTGTTKTCTAPGATPAVGKPFITYVPFTQVAWLSEATDSVATEDGIQADGTATSITLPGATVSAAVPPIITGSATLVRVWYARRVPQPDYTNPADLIRAPEQFARICALGYYLGILSDNQAGGDLRSWRAESEARLTQADLLYRQAVPPVIPGHLRADAWLAG
jgi:hypothetical protein